MTDDTHDWELTQKLIRQYDPDNTLTEAQIEAMLRPEVWEKYIEYISQDNEYVRIKPVRYTEDVVKRAYRPKSLLPGIASHRTSLLAAEPGIGKSAIALCMCAALASAKNVAGFEPAHSYRQSTLFISIEEETSEIALRAAAIQQRYGLKFDNTLHIAGADCVDFLTTDNTISAFIQHGEQELRTLIEEYEAEFVVLDPLSVFPIGEENNSNHAVFFKALNRICADLSCTIMVIHHIRKPPSGYVVRTSLNDVRGSSTIVGAVRSAMILNKNSDYITLTYAKCQYETPPDDQHFIYASETVHTDTGDYRTLVIATHERQTLDLVELQEHMRVLRALFETNETYRCSVQASDWLGTALANNMNVDIGQDQTNNKLRSSEQKQNRTRMIDTLAYLESLNIIAKDSQIVSTSSRHNKTTDVYIAGAELDDTE